MIFLVLLQRWLRSSVAEKCVEHLFLSSKNKQFQGLAPRAWVRNNAAIPVNKKPAFERNSWPHEETGVPNSWVGRMSSLLAKEQGKSGPRPSAFLRRSEQALHLLRFLAQIFFGPVQNRRRFTLSFIFIVHLFHTSFPRIFFLGVDNTERPSGNARHEITHSVLQ